MGAGKAFGNALQEYNLEEEEVYKLLDKTKAYPAGSFVLAAYLAENGKPTFKANDLDFFINSKRKDHIDKLQNFIQYKGYTKMLKLTNPNYKNNINIADVFEYQNMENKKNIQIIVVNCNVEDHIRNFDLDCCQTFWDNASKQIVCYGKNVLEMKTILNPEVIKYNTFMRTVKYIERGFKVYYDDNEITQLCKFINFYKDQIHPEETKKFFLKDPKKPLIRLIEELDDDIDDDIVVQRTKGGVPVLDNSFIFKLKEKLTKQEEDFVDVKE